jgi:adenylate cyclase class IV
MTSEDKKEIAVEAKVEEAKPNLFIEVEVKYSAEGIDRIAFKELAKSLNPKAFVYVESTDIYYAKTENEFLRYRMPSENKLHGSEENRSELTFKKKHKENNNWTRTEVNLRVDMNSPELVDAFCKGLGYTRNFSISKNCDIYVYETIDIVYYSVKDESGKYYYFCEIEALEDIGLTAEQSWEEVLKYEKLLAPLGITAQKRKRLSLWEIFRKGFEGK